MDPMDLLNLNTVSVPTEPEAASEAYIFTSTEGDSANPILVALREFEADPSRWSADLQAFVAGDFFPFAEHVLDDVLTEHDLKPDSPEVIHATEVLILLEHVYTDSEG